MGFGTEESSHVLDDHISRADLADAVGHEVPEAGAGVGSESCAPAREADICTRESAREDVDGLDGIPVDLGDVAEVGNVRPVMLEDLAGAGFDLTEPSRLRPEHLGHGHAKSVVAAEQAAFPHSPTSASRGDSQAVRVPSSAR